MKIDDLKCGRDALAKDLAQLEAEYAAALAAADLGAKAKHIETVRGMLADEDAAIAALAGGT
ncbi:MAG TPA: hypothetical protein VHW01_21705 [Polyangiaceae bacterium]|jgi:hypothetical protein|nr:hypothetical protein [Polyangiaceae bacterium]